MRFLTDVDLSNAIAEVAAEAGACLAVAFWGLGSDVLVSRTQPQSIRVVLNLKMGGTNPYVIETLRNAKIKIRQCDYLHAKVYLGGARAIVASANASSNGLGLEGLEQANWIEAGAEISASQPLLSIRLWFEKLWKLSREISEQDLRDAKAAWKRRQAHKPSLRSFADFDPQSEMIPLVDWYGDDEWEINPAHLTGLEDDQASFLEQLVADGIDIRGQRDRDALTPGRWVFKFKRTQRGLPDQRVHPTWFQLSSVLEKAFRYKDDRDFISCVLVSDAPGPAPFPITDRAFRTAFIKTVTEPAFTELLTDNYQGSWFTEERVACMRRFWLALHKAYRAL